MVESMCCGSRESSLNEKLQEETVEFSSRRRLARLSVTGRKSRLILMTTRDRH
jgi:hypothetical protein